MSNNELILEPQNEKVVEEMLRLKEKHQLKEFNAIEMYGGDGHLLSCKMAENSVAFIGYEINPEKEEGFKKNVINGEFRRGDSVKILRTIEEGEIGVYNLVSTDAPICIYGENYCEHFEILEYIYKLLEKGEKSLCVFPVVPKPYDVEKPENSAWMRRRENFYGTKEVNLDLDKTFDVYDEIFNRHNLQILDKSYVCREYRNRIDWMYEFMYILVKR